MFMYKASYIDQFPAHQFGTTTAPLEFSESRKKVKLMLQTNRIAIHYYHEFIYLFGVLRCFQHCTGHITTGSWKGRGNQYLQFVRVLYCKLPTNGKQLPAFPLEAVPGIEPRPQRWEYYHEDWLPRSSLQDMCLVQTCPRSLMSLVGIMASLEKTGGYLHMRFIYYSSFKSN